MKIFCIGRNYVKHAEELNNEVPSTPLIFMKPQTALLKNSQPFYYPNFSNNIHYECELVLKIGKNGKHINQQFALDYIKEVTVGIDLTARDLQSNLKEKGHSWEIAKAFDHSAPIGEFIPKSELRDFSKIDFHLKLNNTVVQKGDTSLLIFTIPQLIAHISKYFTLQTGDLIFTGTPEGVGPIKVGDQLSASLMGKQVLNFEVK